MGATYHFYNTDLRPLTDLQLDIGTTAKRFSRLHALNASLGGLQYVWPTTITAGYILKALSSTTLGWADPAPSFVSVAKWGTITL